MVKCNQVFWFGTVTDCCIGFLDWDQVKVPKAIGLAVAFQDGMVLVGDGDSTARKVCLTPSIAELCYGDEGVLSKFWEPVAVGEFVIQHWQIKVAFLGGDHGR